MHPRSPPLKRKNESSTSGGESPCSVAAATPKRVKHAIYNSELIIEEFDKDPRDGSSHEGYEYDNGEGDGMDDDVMAPPDPEDLENESTNKSDGSDLYAAAQNVGRKRTNRKKRHTTAGSEEEVEEEVNDEEEEEEDEDEDDDEDEDEDEDAEKETDINMDTAATSTNDEHNRGTLISLDSFKPQEEGMIGNVMGTLRTKIDLAFQTYQSFKSRGKAVRYDHSDLERMLVLWGQYWYIESDNHQAYIKLLERMGDDTDPNGTDKEKTLKLFIDTHIRLESLFKYHDMFKAANNPHMKMFQVIKAKILGVHIFRLGKIALSKNLKKNDGACIDIPGSFVERDGGGQIEKFADKKAKPHQFFLTYLKARFLELGLKRSGTNVYEEIKFEGNPTKAYGLMYNDVEGPEISGIEQFIYDMAREDKSGEQYYNRTECFGTQKFAVKEMACNSELPNLRRSRGLYSFGNGRWDSRTDTFYKYGDMEPPELADQHSIHFIPQMLKDTAPVGPDWITVPHKTVKNALIYKTMDNLVLWDEVTKTGTNPAFVVDDRSNPGQKKTIYPYDPSNCSTEARNKPIRKARSIPTVAATNLMCGQWNVDNQGEQAGQIHKWLFLSLGRLAFPLGKRRGGDDLQFVPMLFGKAGTGKSTLIKTIIKMYGTNDVFHIESSGEGTFALQTAPKKMMWCIQELKAELRLASSRFQNMVSGEHMPIPRKNKDDLLEEWALPGIMAGNDRIPFSDAQGSISRRILSFEYLEAISKVDTTLDFQLEQELPDLIRKSIMVWRMEMLRIGSRDIWGKNVVPQYFHTTKANLKKHVDVVVAFILGNKCARVTDMKNLTERDEFVIPLSELFAALMKHLSNEEKTKTNLSEENLKLVLESNDWEVFNLVDRVQLPFQTLHARRQGPEDPDDNAADVGQIVNKKVEDVKHDDDDDNIDDDDDEIKDVNENQQFPVAVDNDDTIIESDPNEQDDDVMLLAMSRNRAKETTKTAIVERPVVSVSYDNKIYTQGLFVRGITLAKEKGKCNIFREPELPV